MSDPVDRKPAAAPQAPPDFVYHDAMLKPGFGFGHVLSNTFSGLFKNAVPVLLCAVLISGLGAAILQATAAISQTSGTADPDAFTRDDLIGLLASAYLIFLGAFFYAFCMDMSYRTLLGYPNSLKASLRRSLPHALPILAIAILFWAGFFAGYIVFIIPGLILSAGWAVPGPAYMFGKASIFQSFGESWRLTRGYKWMVWLVNFLVGIIAQFGLLILVFIIAIGFAIVQDPELTTDPDAELSNVEAVLLFVGILLVIYLLTAIYASMKSAIYAECMHLQHEWDRRRHEAGRPASAPLESASTDVD